MPTKEFLDVLKDIAISVDKLGFDSKNQFNNKKSVPGTTEMIGIQLKEINETLQSISEHLSATADLIEKIK
jgi:hypothetical protein